MLNYESCKYVLPLKNWVGWITTKEEKTATTSKMYILRKSDPKSKNTLFFPLRTTFYNFVLKIETNWVEKVLKSYLETWNANGLIVYVWLIQSRVRNFKDMQCKKEEF